VIELLISDCDFCSEIPEIKNILKNSITNLCTLSNVFSLWGMRKWISSTIRNICIGEPLRTTVAVFGLSKRQEYLHYPGDYSGQHEVHNGYQLGLILLLRYVPASLCYKFPCMIQWVKCIQRHLLFLKFFHGQEIVIFTLHPYFSAYKNSWKNAVFWDMTLRGSYKNRG
jgi:hypothetical protein